MKILFIHLASQFTMGLAYHENIFPKYLAEFGEVYMIVSDSSSFKKITNECLRDDDFLNKVNLYYLKPRFKWLPILIQSKLRYYKSISSLIRIIKPDLVYVNGLQFTNILELKNIKNEMKFKLLGELNSTRDNSARKFLSKHILHRLFYSSIISRVIDSFDRIYFASSEAYEFTQIYYKLNLQDRRITLGIDEIAIKEKLANSKKNFLYNYLENTTGFDYIASGGKLDNHKEIINLVRAFKSIKFEKTYLVVFGSVEEDIREVFSKEINNKVLFLGWLNSEDTYIVLKNSRLNVFPGSHSILWDISVGLGTPLLVRYWRGREYLDFDGNIVYLYKTVPYTDEIRSRLIELTNNNKLDKMRLIAEQYGLANLSYKKITRYIIDDINV